MSSDFLLHELAALGDWKQIEILFRINAVKDVNMRDEEFEGLTPLHWAVRKGKLSFLFPVFVWYSQTVVKNMLFNSFITIMETSNNCLLL